MHLLYGHEEEGVEAFFQTVCGPLVEAGEWGRDVIRRQRVKTQIKTITLANAMLEEAGIAPGAIDLKTLVPLLDAASLEAADDDEMVQRWAALLANLAAGADGAAVLPSFPRILAELSAQEAGILDALYGGAVPGTTSGERWGVGRHHLEDLQLTLGMEGDSLFDVRLFNLRRLNLCDVTIDNFEVAEGQYEERALGAQSTPLGLQFVAACRRPRGARSGAQATNRASRDA